LSAVAGVAVHAHKARVSWWHGIPIAISAPLSATPQASTVAPQRTDVLDGLLDEPMSLQVKWRGGVGVVGVERRALRTRGGGVVTRLPFKTGDKVQQLEEVLFVRKKDSLEVTLAPLTGAIEQTFAKEGDTVVPNQVIARIVNPASLVVGGDVPAEEVPRIKVGGDVSVMDESDGRRYTGILMALEPVDPASHRANVTVHLTGDGQRLRSGARVELFFH
jgi:multidrug resistance efflux pump